MTFEMAQEGQAKHLSPAEQLTGAELGWGKPLQAWLCEQCDWRYITLPQETEKLRCPHCFTGVLSRYDGAFNELVYSHAPELVIPHSLPPERLEESIQQFARGIPFAPLDLNAAQIRKRLRPVYLPVWLVDSRVKANWKAEAGFYYQVVSHQDEYEQTCGEWVSRKMQETRTRWEVRLGNLEREYHNVPSPALEEHQKILQQVGEFDFSLIADYQPENLSGVFVRLPDRVPEDAWSEAVPIFEQNAAEECRQASGADQFRQFNWQPQFQDRNWSLLLLPVYTSYYLDDQQIPQPVIINGENGRLSGKRAASQQRAQKTSIMLFALAVVLFLVSMSLGAAGVLFPPAFVLAVAVIVLAFLLSAGAVVPVVRVWWFNRSQQLK